MAKHIDDAENQLVNCWEFLAGMKDGRLETESMSLTQFQPTLAQVIFNLSGLHRKVEQEKRFRIERKGKYSNSWFSKRMGFLAKQQELLDAVISICRGLGDGFAWFFYQWDRQYISEHLAEQHQQYTPSGIGGIGELEFIKNVPHIHGFMVIYHGITNILRLGDLSLIDIKNRRVVGIGELKTYSSKPGELKLNLIFSGPNLHKEINSEIIVDSESGEHEIDISSKLSGGAKDRLNRQMERITNSFKKLVAKPEKQLVLDTDGHYKEFNTFVSDLKVGEFSYYRLGKSLLLIGYKSPHKTLYKKLRDTKKKTQFKLSSIENHLHGILLKDCEYNSAILGSFFYQSTGRIRHYPGMTHLLWWPLDTNVIKEILFHDSIVITIYNPAHLLALFKARGYSVEDSGNGDFRIYKIINQGKAQLHGIPFYFEMIQQYLFQEEAIVSLVTQVEDQINSLDQGNKYRIDLWIQQMFGKRLDD